MYSRQLVSFVQAAEAGSFSKAAKSLYISTPSLIQQVNLLEDRLGVTLFERGRKGITLTDAGRSLYEDAIEIMRMSDAAVNRARRMQRDASDPIKIGTSLLLKCRLLPDIWSQMIEERPDVHIEIVSLPDPKENGEEAIMRIGKDVDVLEGLYLSEIYEGRCNFVDLVDSPLHIALPSNGIISSGIPLENGSLAPMNIVTLERGKSRHFDDMQDALRAQGATNISEVPFYNMSVLADCELNGKAIVMPEIWKDIASEFTLVPIQGATCVPYGLVFPIAPSKQVADFMEFAERFSA